MMEAGARLKPHLKVAAQSQLRRPRLLGCRIANFLEHERRRLDGEQPGMGHGTGIPRFPRRRASGLPWLAQGR